MCEQYEDDPYSSFAFGGDHRSDVDFGLATPIHMGSHTKPTLQMSVNRALRGARNHLEKDFGLSSSFCTMPFKCPSMPFQIAPLYDKMLKGMPFQMPFQIV